MLHGFLARLHEIDLFSALAICATAFALNALLLFLVRGEDYPRCDGAICLKNPPTTYEGKSTPTLVTPPIGGHSPTPDSINPDAPTGRISHTRRLGRLRRVVCVVCRSIRQDYRRLRTRLRSRRWVKRVFHLLAWLGGAGLPLVLEVLHRVTRPRIV